MAGVLTPFFRGGCHTELRYHVTAVADLSPCPRLASHLQSPGIFPHQEDLQSITQSYVMTQHAASVPSSVPSPSFPRQQTGALTQGLDGLSRAPILPLAHQVAKFQDESIHGSSPISMTSCAALEDGVGPMETGSACGCNLHARQRHDLTASDPSHGYPGLRKSCLGPSTSPRLAHSCQVSEDRPGFSLHKAASLFSSLETCYDFRLSSEVSSRHLVLAARLFHEWLCGSTLPVFNNEYKTAEA